MSLLKKVFGEKSKKTTTTTSIPEAIIRLKATEDVLLQKQNSLEEKIKTEVSTAKKNVSTNKKVALQAIRRKKRLERQLLNVDGALTTLEAQRDVLETANTNSLAVASMQKASKALKAAHKDVDVQKVEKILDDLAEQREVTDEITDAISQPVNFNDYDIDEEELEKELEELEEDLSEISIDKLPSVPKGDIYKKEKNKLKKEEVLA